MARRSTRSGSYPPKTQPVNGDAEPSNDLADCGWVESSVSDIDWSRMREDLEREVGPRLMQTAAGARFVDSAVPRLKAVAILSRMVHPKLPLAHARRDLIAAGRRNGASRSGPGAPGRSWDQALKTLGPAERAAVQSLAEEARDLGRPELQWVLESLQTLKAPRGRRNPAGRLLVAVLAEAWQAAFERWPSSTERGPFHRAVVVAARRLGIAPPSIDLTEDVLRETGPP